MVLKYVLLFKPSHRQRVMNLGYENLDPQGGQIQPTGHTPQVHNMLGYSVIPLKILELSIITKMYIIIQKQV